MAGEFRRVARQWFDAVPAIVSSGVLRPVGPRAAVALLRAFHRFGPSPALLLAFSAIRFPDRIAVVDDECSLTYRRLHRRASAVAAAIHALAPAPPRSVGVVCRNHHGFVEAMAAGAQLGAELVFVNTELPPSQLRAILIRHDPDVLIYDQEFAENVDAAAYSGLRVLARRGAADAVSGHPTLDELARRRDPAPPRVRTAVRLTLLTSGTTGVAKGVPRAVRPHAIALLCATAMAMVRLRSSDTVTVAPPFFHGFGLAALLGPLTLGATVVTRPRFDAAQTLDDIVRHRVTVLMVVPVMLQRLLAVPGADHASVRKMLRRIITGAAPITATTVSATIDAFGPILVNGYGSTEAGLVTIAAPEDLVAAPHTAGRPALGVSLRVLRADHRPAAPGETGTIFVRTPLDYTGYTPDDTARPVAKEIVAGHVNTGDMGHVDAEGRLYVDGRADDMIVSGGENVFPGEVEDRLTAHPRVADAVVLGVADAEYGQVLHAFVVAVDAAAPPDPGELRDHLRNRLERYKIPKRFSVVDTIPRNTNGKVQRAALRDPSDSPEVRP